MQLNKKELTVLIVTDFKMICKGSNIYLKDTTYNTMSRYKKIFGNTILCTRNYSNDPIDDFVLANDVVDDVVCITSLFNTLLGKHDSAIKEAVKKSDLVIARVPSIVAYRGARVSYKENKPLFSVAIGCAWDAYWNHKFPGKLIAPYMYFQMRWCMKKSDFALYVTNSFLQERYPSTCKSIGVSDVMIQDTNDNIIKERISTIDNMSYQRITLMTSGSVGNKAKGQEYMIKAIPILNSRGIKVNYILAGGDNPTYLKSIARKYNVEEQVTFMGLLSMSQIYELLDKTDIYIQPSLQEGLPRAVVEAMSRGCPVIGAKTGGIPELIQNECIVPRKSSVSLANTIIQILEREKLKDIAYINFEKSKEYLESILSNERNMYYQNIINALDDCKHDK